MSNDKLDYELGFRYHFYELDADNYKTKTSLTSNYKENYAWSLGFKYDLEYIENWNLFLDLEIILKTPFAMFSKKIRGI